jgi:hypothetical protein
MYLRAPVIFPQHRAKRESVGWWSPTESTYGKKLYGSSHAQWGQKVDLGDALSAARMPTGGPIGSPGHAIAKVAGKGGVSSKTNVSHGLYCRRRDARKGRMGGMAARSGIAGWAAEAVLRINEQQRGTGLCQGPAPQFHQ